MAIFNSYVSLPEGTLEVSIESRSVSLGGNKGDTFSFFLHVVSGLGLSRCNMV